MLSLRDKSIVIVGGTSGIGRSAARACLAAGARLVVLGRDDEHAPAARSELSGAIVLVGDATQPSAAENAIAQAVKQFGKLDGLYHVAGGSGRRMGDGPLHEITDEGWHGTLELNLSSVFYSNRAAIRQFLRQRGGGSIVNVASVMAFAPSPKHFATHAYAAAKAGVIALTRTAAARYARDNIRLNAIAPGLVNTPMAARATGDEQIMAYVRHKQPLNGGRIGMPEDLDAAAVYLLSDAARFVTGQVLAIDGGWSITDAAAAE